MNTENHRIYKVAFADVYPLYVAKAQKKKRTMSEVDDIICWLTGYTKDQLDANLKSGSNFEDFFSKAPQLNPKRKYITGTICGIRVEEMQPTTMKEIRYLDKMIDELSKGKTLNKIFREDAEHRLANL